MTMLILDKINLKSKSITRNKKGHYVRIKESIDQEVLTIINMIHQT